VTDLVSQLREEMNEAAREFERRIARLEKILRGEMNEAAREFERRIARLEKIAHTHYYAPDDPFRKGDPNEPISPIGPAES
jgi:hypothetical protein